MPANPGLSLQETIRPVPEIGHRLRFVTATSLFDGHDASINVMRRILQASGVEVIHLGHNRSVREIVDAAIEEDADGIAVSSYQGGHTEFFKYMIDMLRERNRAEIRVFGGGGGVIVNREIRELEAYGVTRIYSPRDGQVMGLQGMIDDMLERTEFDPKLDHITDLSVLRTGNRGELARMITAIENQLVGSPLLEQLEKEIKDTTTVRAPVIGITGTGGSGKSSLTDELVLRWRLDHSDTLQIAILAIDPSRKKTGGALLGDRIRMNAIEGNQIFMRSLATRSSTSETPAQLLPIIQAVQLAGFDLVIVETPGIGQGDSEITSLTDLSLYVMTPEFGAASQLEKVDMLVTLISSRSTNSIAKGEKMPCATCANNSREIDPHLIRSYLKCRYLAPLHRTSTIQAYRNSIWPSTVLWKLAAWLFAPVVLVSTAYQNPIHMGSLSRFADAVIWVTLQKPFASTN